MPDQSQFPTLREVIGLALYLRKGRVIYPLADIDDDARLTPTVLQSMERALGINLDRPGQ